MKLMHERDPRESINDLSFSIRLRGDRRFTESDIHSLPMIGALAKHQTRTVVVDTGEKKDSYRS